MSRAPAAQVEALLALPISDRREAEQFIEGLCALNLDHHFDDGAIDCLYGNNRVTFEQAQAIEDRVADCYSAWEESGANLQFDCPIGHVLKIAYPTECAA